MTASLPPQHEPTAQPAPNVDVGPGRDVLADLLAAVALDAVSDEERALVEAGVIHDDELRAQLDRLTNAAGWLGTLQATPPTTSIRTVVLDRARALRPVTVTSLYRDVIDDARDLLGSLAEADGLAGTGAGVGWTVRELVAHLVATETLVASVLDDPNRVVEAHDLLDATAAAQAAVAAEPLSVVVRRFLEVADRVLAHPLAVAPGNGVAPAGRADERPATVTFMGAPVPVERLLIGRAFEIHTHLCDVRTALGRPIVLPAPAHYRMMAEVAVRSLPAALAVNGLGFPGRTARIVLTGHGAGEWTIPLSYKAEVTEPHITVTAPAVDFCFRAADRLDVDGFLARTSWIAEPGALGVDESEGIVRSLSAVAAAFVGP
jgi:Mycothiol maleylpyruvate isomerase N-terminal domain